MRINRSDLLGQKEASETSLQLRMWTMKHNFFLRYCLCFGVAFSSNPIKRRNLSRRTYKNILQTIKCIFIDIRIKVQDRKWGLTGHILQMRTPAQTAGNMRSSATVMIGKVIAVAALGGSRISRLSHFAKTKSFRKIPSF